MKKLIALLIVFNAITQIVYSQCADSSNFKEINTYLTERNECVELLNDAHTKISDYKNEVIAYDNIIRLKNAQFTACDSIVTACSDENFKLYNEVKKKKQTVKHLSVLLLTSLVIIVLLVI